MRRSQCVRPAGRDPRGNTAELRRVQMDGLLVDLRHFSRWLQPPARLIGSLSGGNPRSMRSRPCLKSSARWIALTTTIAKSESGFHKVNLLPGLIGWISAVDGCLALSYRKTTWTRPDLAHTYIGQIEAFFPGSFQQVGPATLSHFNHSRGYGRSGRVSPTGEDKHGL